MRIGMILDKTFPPDPRVENEAISLIEAGHEVYLFCLNYDGATKERIISGICVKPYKSSKLEYKLSALAYSLPFYNFSMTKKIRHFVQSNAIEAMHVHDVQVAEAAYRAAKDMSIPKVLDLHENRPEIMKFYPHLQKFPGNLLIRPSKWKQKEEQYVKLYDATVVVTQEAKNELLSRVEKDMDRIVVVPNTIRKSLLKSSQIDEKILSKLENDFVLLYIGDTGLRRGLLTAINSLPELRKEIPAVKLVIVGSSTSDTFLKNRVSELKLEECVSFEGWQEPETFPSYVEASAVCISPLKRNQHHDTTYANKIFQYMGFGKPLLVSDATAQKNMVQTANSGLIHQADHVKSFARGVSELYRNKALRAELGKNGKKFVSEEFYWERTSKKLIALYNQFNR